MRPCQPYLAALRRALLAASLIGCVQAILWLVASVAAATLIDLRLASEPLARVLPWAGILAIAAAGAVLLSLSRVTLLNRRRVWIVHALGEQVIEYEVAMVADARQRARSLAAVEVLGRYAGCTAARALADTPWALLAIGGIWFLDIDMAVVASAAALFLIVMTVASAHFSPRAQTFDHAIAAHSDGDAVVRAASGEPETIPGQARAAARGWEATQGAHLSMLYNTAQASGRRRIGAAVILGCVAVMIGSILLERPIPGGYTTGGIIATAGLIMAALAVLARGAIGAPLTAQARAAAGHLLMLRRPGIRAASRHAHARHPRLPGPDLRAPIAASLIVTAATAAALITIVVQANLPPLQLESGLATGGVANTTTDASPANPRADKRDKS